MVIDIFSIVFDIRKANSMKNGQFWPNFRAGEADSWFKLKKTFKMAWRPYFSYPHDEICHVNYKYAKKSCHHKKRVKNWTSETYLNFVDFSSRAWESKFWVKKKFVRPAFNCPTYAKKPQEILSQNIDSPRHKSNFSLEGQNTEISQK